MMKRFLRFFRLKVSGRKKWARTIYWGCVFGSFGASSRILGKITVLNAENVHFGTNSTLNEGCYLNAVEKIYIGSNVHISSHVIIHTGGLEVILPAASRKHRFYPISICDGVWIGAGVIVNPGVTIGENSIIGSGAVVTRDIPPNVVAVGVPAKVIKTLKSN